jgi:hypothetical protein
LIQSFTLSSPGDRYEPEAERVARSVMRSATLGRISQRNDRKQGTSEHGYANLARKGLDHPSTYAVPSLSAAPIQLTHDTEPSSLGHQIAQAIYGSLTPATMSRRETRFSGGESG